MKAFSIWHKGSFVFFRSLRSTVVCKLYIYFVFWVLNHQNRWFKIVYQVNLKWYYIDYLIKKKSLNLSTKLDPKSNNESSLFLEKSNRVDCKTAHETKTRSQKSEFCFCLFCHYVSAITIGLGVMNGFTMLFSRKYWHTPTQGFSKSAPFKGQPLENSNSFASGTSSPALFSASKAINLLWKQSPMQGAFFAEIWKKNTFCHFLADIV